MKKERVFRYDFVRVMAMFIIIIFHFNCSLAAHGISGFMFFPVSYANGSMAHVGVPLFFILSGATLMLSAENNFKLKDYYVKRIRAIYPLFWLGYLMVLSFYFLKYKSIHPFVLQPAHWTSLLSLVGMDGYFAGEINTFYLIGEWFLGCLILMYLLFPILRIGVKKKPKWTAIIVLLVYFIVANNYIFLEDITQNIWIRLPEFVFGMYLSEYTDKIKGSFALIALVGASILYTVRIPNILSVYLIAVMGICSYLVIIFVGQGLENLIHNNVKNIFKWIARHSYAIYLLHHVVSEQIISSFEGIQISIFERTLLFMIVIVADFVAGYLLQKLLTCIRNKVGLLRAD